MYQVIWEREDHPYSVEYYCEVDLKVNGLTVFSITCCNDSKEIIVTAVRLDYFLKTEKEFFRWYNEDKHTFEEIKAEFTNRIIMMIDAEEHLTSKLKKPLLC